MVVLKILLVILGAIGTFWSVLQCYKVLFIVGLFHKKKYKPTQNQHKYGICIPAHNEAKVIKNLLDSINNQDYPKDKLTIFVVADNCQDKTAEIVREFAKVSAIKTFVFERHSVGEKTKGFALKFLFEQMDLVGEKTAHEGFFIFDADNILTPNYVTKMNEAFDEGHDAITSFRNSKNFTQNWISFSYAIHWLRTCLLEHRAKNVWHLSCRIQGTGFLFKEKYVRNGWTYTSLTEDRAFCTDLVVQSGRVVYCEDARFYDEQPSKLWVSLRQRLRWVKGHLQSSVENCPKLLKNVFKFNKNSIRSYDIFFLNFPGTIESAARKLLDLVISITIGILTANTWGVVAGILLGGGYSVLRTWGIGMFQAVFVYCWYHRYVPKCNFGKFLFCVIMFPFFDIIGKWLTYVALFKKVEWKPIPHDYTMDLEQLK